MRSKRNIECLLPQDAEKRVAIAVEKPRDLRYINSKPRVICLRRQTEISHEGSVIDII